MWLNLAGDLFNTDTITVVRRAGSKSECIVFVVGQSAVDSGFLVKVPFKRVAQMLRAIRLTEMSEYIEAAESANELSNESEEEPGSPDGGNDEDQDVEPIATMIQSTDQI